MKNSFSILRSKGLAMKAAVAASVLAMSSAASAALPAWATAMVTEAEENVTGVLALVGPVIAIAIGGFLVIRLIKRGSKQI